MVAQKHVTPSHDVHPRGWKLSVLQRARSAFVGQAGRTIEVRRRRPLGKRRDRASCLLLWRLRFRFWGGFLFGIVSLAYLSKLVAVDISVSGFHV